MDSLSALDALPSPTKPLGLAHSLQQLQTLEPEACDSLTQDRTQPQQQQPPQQPQQAAAMARPGEPAFDSFEEGYLQFLAAHQQQQQLALAQAQQREQEQARGGQAPTDQLQGQYATPPLQPVHWSRPPPNAGLSRLHVPGAPQGAQPAGAIQGSHHLPQGRPRSAAGLRHGLHSAGASLEYQQLERASSAGPRPCLHHGLHSAGGSQEHQLPLEHLLGGSSLHARAQLAGLRQGLRSAGPSLEYAPPQERQAGGAAAHGLPPGSVLRMALESAGPSQEFGQELRRHGLPEGSVLRMALESAGASQEYQLAQERQQGSPAPSSCEGPDAYPTPICSQQEVLDSCELFYAGLQLVHQAFGIGDRVPRVNATELNLHMLYRNVCALGGCETVIERKQWREVSDSFRYPRSITSVSYVFRKAYQTFLWHFEQVYLHGRAGQSVRPPPMGPRELPTASPLPLADSPRRAASSGGRLSKRRKSCEQAAAAFPGLAAGAPTQLVAAARNPGAPDACAVGSRGSVTLDARFDAGFFVTVRLGRQEFQGVLYYPPPEHTRGPAAGKAREAQAPKPAKSPFYFFSADARAKAREALPRLPQTEVTKKVGALWQQASEEAKAPYAAMALQDRQRYTAELEAHNYRLAAASAAQSAGQAAASLAAAQRASSQQPLPGARSLGSQGTPTSEEASNTMDAGRHQFGDLPPF